MSLPSTLNFGDKSLGVSSKIIDSYLQPTTGSGSYSAGSTITFNVGGRPNQFLNGHCTYLRANVACTQNSYFDNSAHSLIQRLTVYSPSGAIIEDINDYAVLAGFLNSQLTSAERVGLSAMNGCEKETHSWLSNTSISNNARQGAYLSANTYSTVCINLFSSVIGSLCQKLTPIGLNGEGWRVDLQLADTNKILYQSTAGTATIKDVELITNIVELDNQTANELLAMNGNQYKIHCVQFRNSTISLANSSTGTQQLLCGGMKFASLKAIVGGFFNYYNTANAYSVSSSINAVNGGGWQFYIGNNIFPNKVVSCTNSWAESLSYLRGAWHVGANPNEYSSTFSSDFCNNADGTYTAGNSYKNASYFGINLDGTNYQKSNLMYSGLNTLNDQTFLRLELGSNTRTNPVTISLFAMHDALITIENGIASVSY